MTCTVELSGRVVVGGPGCGCSGSSSPNQKIQGLSFGCPGVVFGAVASTDCAVGIATAGAVGDAFVELPTSDSLGAFHLLVVKTTAPAMLRIGAAPAQVLGSGGSFPTGFGGGETLTFDVDGTTVAVTFTAGAQSAAQVAAEINQAAIGAGLSFLPASVQSSGQLRLAGSATGSQGSLEVTSGNATVGLPTSAAVAGSGEDVRISGTFMAQFDTANAPSRIQVSGSAQIEVLSAGTALAA